MKSYKKQRMRELSEGVRDRNKRAGAIVVENIKRITPVGTPESTGDPDYRVTMALRNSIQIVGEVTDKGVTIGTKKPYAVYVHQGTYDYNRGRGPWTEAEAREFNSMFNTGDGPGRGRKGMRPRSFMVNGLLNSRAFIEPIYRSPIKGGRR